MKSKRARDRSVVLAGCETWAAASSHPGGGTFPQAFRQKAGNGEPDLTAGKRNLVGPDFPFLQPPPRPGAHSSKTF